MTAPHGSETPLDELLARQIRAELAELNDPQWPVVLCVRDVVRRLREAEEQLRIAKEDAEIHLEAANRWSERAERLRAERKLQGPVGAFDDDF